MKVTFEVLCGDMNTAHKVISEFLPAIEDMIKTPGVLGVTKEWTVEGSRPEAH